MEKIKALWLKYKQFILFCCVGVSNTVVALIVSWLLLRLCSLFDFELVLFGFNLAAGTSSILGDIAGAVNSYLLNSKFVFDGRNRRTGPKFIACVCNICHNERFACYACQSEHFRYRRTTAS